MECRDVVIAGAGNAGLCAAIAAAQIGRKVTVLEAAPRNERGGNSSLTMNLRFAHEDVESLLTLLNPSDAPELELLQRVYKPYPPATFAGDLIRASRGKASRNLIQELSERCYHTVSWLRELGHVWEVKPANIQMESSLPIRLLGGGRELQRRNFENAERLGVEFVYGAGLDSIVAAGRRVSSVICRSGSETTELACNALILSTGGFQGSRKLRGKYLGDAWQDAKLRGVPFNDGRGIEAALQVGAGMAGDFSKCHATPQRAGLADFILPGGNDESQENSRYGFYHGITVNLQGRRFIDEVADHPNFLYAAMGAAIQSQPGKIAFQLFDHRGARLLPRRYSSGGELRRAESLDALARHFGIDPEGLADEVRKFNHEVATTRSATPSESGRRESISQAPFYIAPVRAGLTFTYGGLAINAEARILDTEGIPFSNFFGCGELVGGLFYDVYPGGSGMMAGAHFGKIAGTAAAQQ